MRHLFSQHLLPALQLTRIALVFTAIADAQCTLLLWASFHAPSYQSLLSPGRILATLLISVGLYGFGMSLNDIVDRRRDQHIAANRPLPSGRITLLPAYVICFSLLLLALLAGLYYTIHFPQGYLSLLLILWTASLIVFYDLAGKYLVGPGLLALGLIRFFHALIPIPSLPLLWHPLFLLNHVTLLSLVAYRWEAKRPRITPLHWWVIFAGLLWINLMTIAAVAWRRYIPGSTFPQFLLSLGIQPALLLPLAAIPTFLLFVRYIILPRSSSLRKAGRSLVLTGLLWLIIYDAAFVASYVALLPALLLLLLLPLAYLSVLTLRWASRFTQLPPKPNFKRSHTKIP